MTVFRRNFCFIGIALLLFSFARLLLFFLYHETFADLTGTQILWGFVQGVRFDMASIMVFLGIPMLLMVLPFRACRSKIWGTLNGLVLYFVTLGIAALLAGDVLYYSFVKRHITTELLFLSQDIGYLKSEALSRPAHSIAALAGAFLLLYIWMKLLRIPMQHSKSHFWKFLFFICMVGIMGRGGIGMKPLAIINAYESGNSALGNLTLNGVFSASHSTLLSEPVDRKNYSEAELVQMLDLKKDFFQQDFPLEQNNAPVLETHPNVVIVMIESLTNKYVDSFGNRNYKLTPNLDKIAREGVRFPNFYANGQRSVEGLQSILTGMPSVIGLPVLTDLAASYSKIASITQKNGYSQVFVNSTDRKAFLTDAIAGATGFHNYYGREDMPLLLEYIPSEANRRLGWDYETLIFTLQQIQSLKPPFLAYASLTTDHTPFPEFPAPFNKFPHDPSGENGYLNSLYYTDWAIGKFIENAKKEAWFDQTIFVFLADHAIAHFQGNSFLSHFKTPLILYAPKLLKPGQIDTVSSQLDLLPTFVELLNLNGPYSTLGESLLHKEKDMAMVREGSVVGIITDKGYLKHSLQQRLETQSFKTPMPPEYFDKLEQILLGWDQIAYDLIQKNRWAQ